MPNIIPVEQRIPILVFVFAARISAITSEVDTIFRQRVSRTENFEAVNVLLCGLLAFFVLAVCVGTPLASLNGNFEKNSDPSPIPFAIVMALLQLVLPVIVAFVFWLIYPEVINDLKQEYSKRHPPSP